MSFAGRIAASIAEIDAGAWDDCLPGEAECHGYYRACDEAAARSGTGLRCAAVSVDDGKGVAAVSRDTGIPVIFGVLTTDTMQQALERAGIKSNLGWSYGLQAIEMGSLMAALPG